MCPHRCVWTGILGLTLAASLLAAPVHAAELDKYLPDDTQVVLTINVRQILDSAVVKKYLLAEVKKGIAGNAELKEFQKLLGLDLPKDVTSITLASPGGTDKDKGMVIVHGSFDLAKIHAVADDLAQKSPDKLTIHKQDNLRIYEGKTDKQAVFASLLNKEIMVISDSKAYVVDAVAKSSGKKETKLNKDLQELVRSQDGKQSLWLAGLVSTELKMKLKDLIGKNQQKDLADKLQSLSGGLSLTEDVKLNFRIQTSDPKGAQDIRQQLEALKGLATLVVSTNEQLKDVAPELLNILNAFKFSQDKGTVGVEITVTADLIDKSVKKAKP